MKYFIFALLMIMTLSACNKSEQAYMPVADYTDNSKPVSYGNHQDVYVFSNQELSKNTLNIMEQQFGYPFEGAQKERTFELIWKSFDNFEELKKAKNLIFICNLGIQDEFTAFVQSKIPQEKLDSVMKSSSTMLTYQNEWSDDQLVTFVLASEERRIEDILVGKMAVLYLDYQKRFLQRMTKRVYYRDVLKGKDFTDYNFSLQIPSTFQLYKEDKVEDMISFIYRYKKKDTVLPDKYITVHWEKMDIRDFDEFWVRKSRENIGKVILDGDVIDWNRTKLMPKTFITWKGMIYLGFLLEGAWENDETEMGGSFRSYCIYDDRTNTAYFIDTAVYYPAGTKIPYLFELEGIAKSFKIKE